MAVRKSKKNPKELDGKNVLYHYLQHDMRNRDIWMFQALTARLISELAIWFDPEVYRQLPVFLPHVVRDASGRKRGRSDKKDEWGSANSKGFLRDDNSLIKGIPRSLDIRSPQHQNYEGKRIGDGWVASHVWRYCKDGSMASKNPLTNSFVGNLVWLPSVISILTDREGAFVQRYTQALAHKIYAKESQTHPGLEPLVKGIWDSLDLSASEEIPAQGLPDVDKLNYFVPTEAWFRRRHKPILNAAEALERIASGEQLSKLGRLPARWLPGVLKLTNNDTAELRKLVGSYASAVKGGS